MSLGYYTFAGIWNAVVLALSFVLIAFKAPPSRIKHVLMVFVLAPVSWSIFFVPWARATTADEAMLYQRLFTIGGSLAVPLTLHFTLTFLERPISRTFLAANYGFTLVFNVINFSTHWYVSGFWPVGPIPFYPLAGPFHPVVMLHLGANLVWSFLMLYREMKNPASTKSPQQIKWLLLGILIGWTSGSFTYFGFYRIPIEPVLTPFASMFTVCFVYAMVRHKLLDVELVIRRAVVFAGLFAIVSAAMVVATSALPVFLHDHLHLAVSQLVINVVAFIALFYGLQPIRRILIDWTDRYLFQRDIDYPSLLAKIAREGGRFAGSKELASALVEQIVSGLRLKGISLYLVDVSTGRLELHVSKGSQAVDHLATDDPLVKLLDMKRQPFGLETRSARQPSGAGDTLRRLGGHLALPILNDHSLTGLLVLGERASEKPYSQDDLDALVPLSRLVGVLLANSLLRQDLQVAQARVAEAAFDALTGVYVRSALLEQVEVEAIRARYFARPFAILMADLDFFKQKNDTYGHPAGDLILKEAAARMRRAVRPTDLVGRYGGEEFLIYLDGASRKDAQEVAERIRQKIAQEKIDLGQTQVTQTVSIGISCFPEDSQDVQRLIERADGLLYEAKRGGRNVVVALPKNAA